MFLRTMEYPLNKDFKPSPEDMARLRKELTEANKRFNRELSAEQYEILSKARSGGNTHCAIEEMENDR